jgi:hypothetical protein
MMKDEQGPDMGLIVVWTLALVMTGSWEGIAVGGAEASRTAQQEIARLEASGELPVLDREPTLGGIDANTNGVRDDIERYIEKKYTVAAQRKAAMQTARALQQTLLVNKEDSVELDLISAKSFRAVACLDDTFVGPDAPNSTSVLGEVRAITTNTNDRLKAYLAYNHARSGSVSRLPEGGTCE